MAEKHAAPARGKAKERSVAEDAMPAERAEIIDWLKNVKFRGRLFGGVDERNVWRKISELDALYTKALEAERVRYDALLDEYKLMAARRIRALQEQGKGGGPGG
jgi:hypothetical protein